VSSIEIKGVEGLCAISEASSSLSGENRLGGNSLIELEE
jgi:succinate dehydrogenase/fumarate reductase flavoprotein subunit